MIYKMKIKYFIYRALLSLFLLAPAFSNAANNVVVNNPLGTNDVQTVINNVLNAFLGIAGTIAVAMLVWGGILYMTSGDNKDLHEKAVKTLTRAVVGLIIIMIAGAAVNFVIKAVQGS